jgi:hypothetical protein
MAQDQQHHEDHGHSVAAWTMVGLISLGTIISAVAFPLESPAVFWAGVVVIALTLVIGYVWSRSSSDAEMPSYNRTEPVDTEVEGPSRSSEGTNRP